MKILLISTFLIFISTVFSQNYIPFKDSVYKRFHQVNNPTENDNYFYPRQTEYNGDTIFFSQYLSVSSQTINVEGTDCEGWGGYEQSTADTSWLGRSFYYLTSTKELVLQNDSLEELSFDFGLSQGDSALFYSKGSEEYYIKYEGQNQELVIDSLENVKLFSIWKYDDQGTPIPSSLNGFNIKISENLGLFNFIVCNQFPQVEKKMTLMGQVNPTIGYYQLTYDEVFPWAPGDTLETRGTTSHSVGGFMGESHKLITIDERVETTDSVWIFLNVETQVDEVYNPYYSGGIFNISYPNPIVYKKGEQLTSIPNNSILNGYLYVIDSNEYCGNRKRFYKTKEMIGYCESCDCFTPYDGDGSSWEDLKYHEELGITTHSYNAYGSGFSDYAELIYSNIGGVKCGEYNPLSLEEYSLNSKRELIKVTDLLGRETEIKPNQVLIYIYSDGSSEKIFKAE